MKRQDKLNFSPIIRALWLRSVELSVRIKNIMGYISIADRRTLVSIWSQDRKRSQTISKDRAWFYLLRSRSQDRGRSQKCVSIWSQTIEELSAICDPWSSAIIWKPAFNIALLERKKKTLPFFTYFPATVKTPSVGPGVISNPASRARTGTEPLSYIYGVTLTHSLTH